MENKLNFSFKAANQKKKSWCEPNFFISHYQTTFLCIRTCTMVLFAVWTTGLRNWYFFATTLFYIYKRLFKLTFLPGNVLRFNSIVIHISQKQNTQHRNYLMMKVTLGFIIRCQFIVKCVNRVNTVVQMMNGKIIQTRRKPDVPFDIVSSRKCRNNCNYITELCYFLHFNERHFTFRLWLLQYKLQTDL